MSEIKKAHTSRPQVIHRIIHEDVAKPSAYDNRKSSFQWVEKKKKRFSDRLITNTIIATAILFCVTVVHNFDGQPQAQSVFENIQKSVTLNLDEALGKLSFVSNILPETALVFWDDSSSKNIMSPIDGEIIHVFNSQEPYITMKGRVNDVRAAAEGELMSLAHSYDEEIIVRLRHPDGTETLYGNLRKCYLNEGDHVYKGDLIGEAIDNAEVYFELRKDGRPIDPTYYMMNEMDETQ